MKTLYGLTQEQMQEVWNEISIDCYKKDLEIFFKKENINLSDDFIEYLAGHIFWNLERSIEYDKFEFVKTHLPELKKDYEEKKTEDKNKCDLNKFYENLKKLSYDEVDKNYLIPILHELRTKEAEEQVLKIIDENGRNNSFWNTERIREMAEHLWNESDQCISTFFTLESEKTLIEILKFELDYKKNRK